MKESDTGLAVPSEWDLVSDKQMMQEEQPLQVARCTGIRNDSKYVINVKQIARFVVGLGDKVSTMDIEEGMHVGVDCNKYQIQIPLPPKIDSSVTMMTVEEKPDVTHNDIWGGGILCYGPPETGKTLLACAVVNQTNACFIRVIGSEVVQKYVGEGARMVHELFQKACIVFLDEVDAIGGARFDDESGGGNEVHRTMLEIVNQLYGFDAHGNIEVLMATNRVSRQVCFSTLILLLDILDPALLQPGQLDWKVEFRLPDLESWTQIFEIHAQTMNCEWGICFELLSHLCPNSIAHQKTVTERDFLEVVDKVIKGYQDFSATPKYMVYS
ncbi:hypothetical protein CY35_08G145400 [Sphagnum magellanicum]|nr:hypothetical protein CY35_08G145400 [Sphagnum magellanicum]